MNIHIDMPCTTDIHIVERAPDIAAIIFKDRNGCFEKPSLDKEPSYLSLPKLKVELYRNKVESKAMSEYVLV